MPFWIIEFILFIPNIILFPFIRTIIDVYTRRQQTQESIILLVNSLSNLLNYNPEDFDTLVEVLSFDQGSNHHIFKSLNSQDLIADLHFARVEEQIKPQILKLLKDNSQFGERAIGDPFNLKFYSYLYEKYPPLSTENGAHYPSYPPKILKKCYEDYVEEAMRCHNQGNSLLYRIIYARNDSIDLMHQKLRRQKQLSVIVDYLKNPENNGSKLAQYFQVNIINLQNNKSTREGSLKQKAQIECERLEQISNYSSLIKKNGIKAVIESESFHEKKFMRALLFHRGFGFFGRMTSSFDNVYCTDIPSVDGDQNLPLNGA